MIEIFMTLGYAGAFLSGFFSTFTLFLPSPTFIIVFFLASQLNPLALGIVGGIGAAIGEMIGYGIGYGFTAQAEKLRKKYKKYENYVNAMFKRFHPDVIIFIFAAAPILPFDLVGILCGAIKYDKKHFFLVTLLGKIIKYLVIAYAGFYGASWLVGMF